MYRFVYKLNIHFMSMKFFLCLLIYFLIENSYGQIQSLDVSGAAIGSAGSVKFNDPSAIGQKKADKIDYSEIRGNYFWSNEWKPALLILRNGNGIKVNKLKLNFYTSDIHYLDSKGTELVAQPGQIKQVIIYDKTDTAKAIAFFQAFASYNPKSTGYAQQLVNGKIQFLKKSTVTLVKDQYDPSLGKSELRFVSTTDYFIVVNSSIHALKRINHQSVFTIITPTQSEEEWLSSTKNKLKTEEEVIAFLTFVNSTKQ